MLRSPAPPARDPEDRIHQLFDNPPAGPLSAAELTLYFADPISRSALGNAIQFNTGGPAMVRPRAVTGAGRIR